MRISPIAWVGWNFPKLLHLLAGTANFVLAFRDVQCSLSSNTNTLPAVLFCLSPQAPPYNVVCLASRFIGWSLASTGRFVCVWSLVFFSSFRGPVRPKAVATCLKRSIEECKTKWEEAKPPPMKRARNDWTWPTMSGFCKKRECAAAFWASVAHRIVFENSLFRCAY